MRSVGLVAGSIVWIVSACASGGTSATPEEAGNLQLPARGEQLPPDVDIVLATEWADASRRLPAGVDADARWESEIDAIQAVTLPFGDRPMPPNSPGITGEPIFEEDPAVIGVLVTVPISSDPAAWGEQFALVLRAGSGGWALDQAFSRTLCVEGADAGPCAEAAAPS